MRNRNVGCRAERRRRPPTKATVDRRRYRLRTREAMGAPLAFERAGGNPCARAVSQGSMNLDVDMSLRKQIPKRAREPAGSLHQEPGCEHLTGLSRLCNRVAAACSRTLTGRRLRKAHIE